MKKILFISSRPIYPIFGGDQIRTAQQLDFLLQRYSVDIVYLSEKKHEQIRISDVQPGVGNVVRFYIPKIKFFLQTLGFFFNKLPLQVNYFYNNKVQNYISSVLRNYDAVFCNNIRTAEYVIKEKGIVKYMDFVDAVSMNYDKAKYHAWGIKKIIYSIDSKRCIDYEQHILRTFDRCAIISDVDKDFIQCHRKYM